MSVRFRRERLLEISQIQYFVALCAELNFTRAAKRCSVSQPSLSNGLKALESDLGGPLFQRAPIALTPLGKRVRPHLESVISSLARARRTARSFQRHQLRHARAEANVAIGGPERASVAFPTPSLNA